MRIDFYMGPEFLRTERKTNPFFDPIIKVCEENGIEWRVLFPGKPKVCGYPADKIASFGFWQSGSVWFWRIVHLFWHAPTWRINHFYGRILGWFGVLKSEFAITIGGWAATELAGANPTARIVDVQHGVIFSRHGGYFDEHRRLVRQYQLFRNREFWLYGKGYADCFFKHPNNAKDLDGRVKVIGDVVRANSRIQGKWGSGKECRKGTLIIIASQMTPDFGRDILKTLKLMYEEVFTEANGCGNVVVFRHHPRFGDCIDLSDWNKRFPYVIMNDNRPWAEIFAESKCLVTVHSTTAFDAAVYGVPIVFLDEKRLNWPNVMKGDFGYPYPTLTISDICGMPEGEIVKVMENVKKWYAKYYEPFNSDRCLNMLHFANQ